MTMDYSSSANTLLRRAKPVSVIGTVPVSGTVTATPGASATVTGTTPFRGTPTNTSMAIKGSSGRVYGLSVSNPGAAACYFNIYNIVTATVGTTVPVLQVLVPAGQTVVIQPAVPLSLGTGICCAATDTSAVLSAVAPATLPVANVQYL
jgi:hypothetical protein